jgi:hypothetical protein
MSWTFNAVGKPVAVSNAVDAARVTYSGQSKQEFDDAAPHLKFLIEQNLGNMVVAVVASGHASFEPSGKKTYGVCSVEIKQIHGFVE